METTEMFESARLRMARDLNGMSQAALASQVGITPAAISQFEADDSRPSADTLQQMADALGVPVQFLCRPVEETHEGFFRSLRKSSAADRRRARSLAHLVHDLATDPESAPHPAAVSVPSIPVPTLDIESPLIAKAARKVRQEWGIAPGPISDVVAALEQHGILVIRLPLDASDVDAFSLPFPDRPVVVLGADKDDRGRSRFDAAHELGHLVMHGESVWGVKEVESQAHRFAAEFLMPAADIRDELPARADWSTLFALKRRWQVSIAALVMRAKDLGVMSPSAYTSAMKGISARGWRRAEPIPLGGPEACRQTMQLLAVAHSRAVWFPDHLLPALDESVQVRGVEWRG